MHTVGLKRVYDKFPNGDISAEYYVDDNGDVQGEMKKYFENGSIKGVFHFTDGKRDGLQTEYWHTGELRLEMHIKNGVRDGLWRNYELGGRMARECNYINNKRSGVWKCWTSGVLREIYIMVEDSLHGEGREFSQNGKTPPLVLFFAKDVNITEEVINVVKDIENITKEEKLMIFMKWGIKCLD